MLFLFFIFIFQDNSISIRLSGNPKEIKLHERSYRMFTETISYTRMSSKRKQFPAHLNSKLRIRAFYYMLKEEEKRKTHFKFKIEKNKCLCFKDSLLFWMLRFIYINLQNILFKFYEKLGI